MQILNLNDAVVLFLKNCGSFADLDNVCLQPVIFKPIFSVDDDDMLDFRALT